MIEANQCTNCGLTSRDPVTLVHDCPPLPDADTIRTFNERSAKAIAQCWSDVRDAIDKEINEERKRQDAKWGVQDLPNGTDYFGASTQAAIARDMCDHNTKEGRITFADILREEVYEAMAAEDDANLRLELIQVAAVAKQWIEAIDRRKKC